MNTLIFFVTFTCGPIYTENRTTFDWNNHDKEILAAAKKRCPAIYRDAPCVGKFIKTGVQDYQVLCKEALSYEN